MQYENRFLSYNILYDHQKSTLSILPVVVHLTQRMSCMIALISSCLLIIVTSAVASGTEAALFSISVSKLKSLTQDKRVKATLQIKENIESSIRAIVIVNNITNIIGSIMVGYLAEKEFLSWHEIYDIPYVGIFPVCYRCDILLETLNYRNVYPAFNFRA